MSLNFSKKIITDNLLAYYDAANKESYPSSGTQWSDLSGNDNHLTLYNTPTFANTYFTFDTASAEYANGTIPDFRPDLTGYTMEILVKVNAITDAWRSICNIKNNGDNKHIDIRLNATTTNVYADTYTLVTDYTTTAYDIGLNTWTHIAHTYNNNEIKLYINGDFKYSVSVSAAQFTTWDSGAPELEISRAYSNDRNTPTSFSFFKLYNRPLSPNEVLNNFEVSKKRFGL